MPFFTCINVLFEKEAHIDIEKYLYCKEFGVAPYPGSFNDQPKRWVDRMFIIKKAFNKGKSRCRIKWIKGNIMASDPAKIYL